MEAIYKLTSLTEALKPSDTAKEIWIFGEFSNKNIAEVVYELLGCGKILSKKLDAKVAVIVLNECCDAELINLFKYGANIIYRLEKEETSQISDFYPDEIFPDIIAELVIKHKPEIFLFGATIFGCSVAPRVATKLKTGLTADCTELDIDDKNLLNQTRPTHGELKLATIICENSRPQMATVRPSVFEKPNIVDTTCGEIISFTANVSKQKRIEFLGKNPIEYSIPNLSAAEVIISVGMGIESENNMHLIKELSEILKAPIGATKLVVNNGWIDHSHQVGQTGLTVRPKLYIACGISGSLQHYAGIKSTDVIISINKDPDAPIHKYSTWSIVADLSEFLPILISKLKSDF
jgi:electron transfer flavoprotein alpha subunit